MRRLSLVALALALAAAIGCKRNPPAPAGEAGDQGANTPGNAEPPAARKGFRGTFTVGKATTYITGPLDAEGYPDYAAAINERLSKGVTPENNANVLLWKALGPHPDGVIVPPGYFEKLGIPAPPARRDYFVGLGQHVKNRPGASDTLNRLSRQPWTAEQAPDISAWLEANEKPLKLVGEATGRTHYCAPFAPGRDQKGPTALLHALPPGLEWHREFAGALAAWAMLACGNGNADAAWRDLLACHRLGRLLGRGSTLIENLVGMAIESIACRGELAFLEHAKPDATRLQQCLRDLRGLPTPRPLADAMDGAERFLFLDIVLQTDRRGVRFLETLQTVPKFPGGVTEDMLAGIDWDPALELANRWHDRVAAALRHPDRAERARLFEAITRDILALKAVAFDPKRVARLIDEGKEPAAANGQVVGEMLLSFTPPMIGQVQDAADRATQAFENTVVAFALELYHRENGRYPERLDALAPKYLAKVPQDLFAGGPLVYRPTANGYVLYSVGVNGTDDGGRGHEDRPQGDDLVVRVPAGGDPNLP